MAQNKDTFVIDRQGKGAIAIPTVDTLKKISSNGGGGSSTEGIESIQPGSDNVTINNSDPKNPIISVSEEMINQDNIQRIIDLTMEDIGATDSDTDSVIDQKILAFIKDPLKNPYINVGETELPPKFRLMQEVEETPSGSETPESIKSKYESNPNTNAFTDVYKELVDNSVQQEIGKTLTSNDFTTTEKNKLNSLNNISVSQNLKRPTLTTDYIITINAYINSTGLYTTTSATGWKFASLKLLNYKKIRITGISARPGNPLFFNFATTTTSVTPISYGTFVANDIIEIDIPNGASYLNIDVKASTDADDSVFTNLKFEYLVDTLTVGGFESDTLIAPTTINSIQSLRRKPTIVFIFDDGLTTDSNVYTKLNTYGYKAGFAIITSTLAVGRIPTYLGYQINGYEILSHTVNHVHMETTSVITETNVRNELGNSLNTLRGWGFTVNGFVTPYSTLAPEYIPIMNEYYNYGFTSFYGQPTVGLTANHKFKDSLLKLKRLNIEGTDMIGIKAEIAKTVTDRGILFIYAHQFPNASGLTDIAFTEILDYVKTFTDSGNAQVMTPTQAINYYYRLSHEDLVGLIP